MRVWARRPISILLFGQILTGCAHSWQSPKPAVAPEAFVVAKHPRRVMVIDRSGRKVKLREPVVSGDSLVEGPRFQRKEWESQWVALPRPAQADMTVVKRDGERIRTLRLITADGELEVHDPILTDDSLVGTVRVQRTLSKGVPLREVAQFRVRAVSTSRTVVFLVLDAALVAVGIAGVIALRKATESLP